jgi:hypothetical protein
MNNVIKHLKDTKQFPEWYEGLHKSLFRASEFMGKFILIFNFRNLKNNIFFSSSKDDRNISKDEFVNMMLTWSCDEDQGL